MLIFPAVDLYEGKAVRLVKGDFNKMTVYSGSPADVARSFKCDGAEYLHTVDLNGAKTGINSCVDIIKRIVLETGMFVQSGGGIRNLETVDALMSAGVSRVILGTAAVLDRDFLCACIKRYSGKIAVGADIKNGFIAVKGWAVTSDITADAFFEDMEKTGVKTIVCTDISKDGMMSGTNIELYREILNKYGFNIIASGGVSSYEDIEKLSETGVYGAILGKALYEGKIELKRALTVAGGCI